MYPKADELNGLPMLPFRNPLTHELPSEDEEDEVELVASGGDSSGGEIADSVDEIPCGLRIMSWNLQDLGGGPSRGPRRGDDAITMIARIIRECDADLCVIQEVKRQTWLPPKPIQPTEPRETRGTPAATVYSEYEKRKAEYEVRLQEWRQRHAQINSDRTAPSPGNAELDRIVRAINDLGGIYRRLDPETSFHLNPEQVFTAGETYGFIYKPAYLTPQSFRLLNRDGDNDLYWPELGFRCPAEVVFSITNRVQRLRVIAYHAPAPHHGEQRKRAISQFRPLPWEIDTVVAADLNVDTEARDLGTSDEALDTLLSFYDGPSEYFLAVRADVTGTFKSETVRMEFNHSRAVLCGRFTGVFLDAGDATSYAGEFDGVLANGYDFGFLDNHELQDGEFELTLTNLDVTLIDTDRSNYQAVVRDSFEAAKRIEEGNQRRPGGLEDPQAWSGAGPTLERTYYAIDAGTGESTSLRRLVVRRNDDPFDRTLGGYWSSKEFNSAGYDKIMMIEPPFVGGRVVPIDGYAYPLFERCLPVQALKLFDQCYLRDLAIGPRRMYGFTEGQLQNWGEMENYWRALEEHQGTGHEPSDEEEDDPEGEDEGGDDPEEEEGGDRVDEDEQGSDPSGEESGGAMEISSQSAPSFGSDGGSGSSDDSSFVEGQGEEEEEAAVPDDEEQRLYREFQASIEEVQQMMQAVLKFTRELSDHVPLILDVKLMGR